MDRLTGYQPYVFMQDGARSHTANETVRFLNQQRYLTLLQPNMWPPNSPDLCPVDYCVWSALERNVYRGRRFENTIELKETILQEWEALPQAVINNAIDRFRSRIPVGHCRKRTTHRKILNKRTIAYNLCRVNFHAIAVCDNHYLNTCNFVILWKFLIKFYTATQCIVVKCYLIPKKVKALCLRVQFFLANPVFTRRGIIIRLLHAGCCIIQYITSHNNFFA